MSKGQKAIFFGILVVASLILGRVLLNAPMAHIQFAAETIIPDAFGVWNITNSMIAAWLAMAVLIIFALLSTRNMQMVPRGLQNFTEAVVGWLLGIVESIAGQKKGRVFFPLVATIFFFILIANWMSLIPIFGTVGPVETAKEFIHHHTETAANNLGLPVPHGEEKPDPRIVEEVKREAANQKMVIFNDDGLKTIPLGFSWMGITMGDHVKEIRLGEYWDFDRWHSRTGVVQSGKNQVDLTGKTVGILVPYLRGMNTDLMNPLAFAIIAVIMIEYWGIKYNGLLSYGSRFLNFKSGPIGVFVGLLETVSEIARLISFTARLMGNMFAGEVVIFAFMFLMPFLVVIFPMLLETFVGFIQAVVFAALTLLFAALATESHEKHEEKHEGATPEH